MATVAGVHEVVIERPREHCVALLVDVARYPQWYDTLDDVEILDADPAGRAARVRLGIDVPRTHIAVELELGYDLPSQMRAVQSGGNGHVVAFAGTWRLVALGPDRTRARYELSASSGRLVAGALFRASAGLVRRDLIEKFAEQLKVRAERGASDRG